MKTIFFSSNLDTINEWKQKYEFKKIVSVYDILSLEEEISKIHTAFIVITDYDSVAHDINKLLTSNTLPKNTIILEKSPEISSGKMLISHGVKAYGNARMSQINFKQMLETVKDGKVWTYPELTASLAKDIATPTINNDTKKLINKRLSPKEIQVVYAILDGLTNDAIASALEITTRTVKAHVSSIFSKLHVNDRISLVLLLK